MTTLSQHRSRFTAFGAANTSLNEDSILQILAGLRPVIEASVDGAITDRLSQLRKQRAAAVDDSDNDEPTQPDLMRQKVAALIRRLDGAFDRQALPAAKAETYSRRAKGETVSMLDIYSRKKAEHLAPAKHPAEIARDRCLEKRHQGKTVDYRAELAAAEAEAGVAPSATHYAKIQPPPVAIQPSPVRYSKVPPPAGTSYVYQDITTRAHAIAERRHKANQAAGRKSYLPNEIRRASNELFEIVVERMNGKISTIGGLTTSKLYRDYDKQDLQDLDFGARCISDRASKLAQSRTLSKRAEGKGASFREELPKALRELRIEQKLDLDLQLAAD